MSAADTILAEALWAEEAEARIDAYEKSTIQADSAEAVLQRINTRTNTMARQVINRSALPR